MQNLSFRVVDASLTVPWKIRLSGRSRMVYRLSSWLTLDKFMMLLCDGMFFYASCFLISAMISPDPSLIPASMNPKLA